MDYAAYFRQHGLNSITEFFDFCLTLKYGWRDQTGNYHTGVNSAKAYALQEPRELLQSKVGNCWDFAELYRCWFQAMTTLPYETYYIFYDDGKGCPSHAVFTFQEEKQLKWFEPMMQRDGFAGIHRYKNLHILLNTVTKKFLQYTISDQSIPQNYDQERIRIYQYTKPLYHINGCDLRAHIERGVRIK